MTTCERRCPVLAYAEFTNRFGVDGDMRVASVLLPILLLAGCSSPAAPAPGADGIADATPQPSAPSAAQGSSDACETGAGDVFLASVHLPGPLPDRMRPRLVEISREGIIRILQAHTEPGNGEIIEEPEGALHDLTMEEARAMLARRNYTYEEEDLVITRGDRATLPADVFASFCQSMVAALPALADEYPHAPGCEHAMTLVWDVSTADTTRRISMSDCAADAEAFSAIKRDFERLVGTG